MTSRLLVLAALALTPPSRAAGKPEADPPAKPAVGARRFVLFDPWAPEASKAVGPVRLRLAGTGPGTTPAEAAVSAAGHAVLLPLAAVSALAPGWLPKGVADVFRGRGRQESILKPPERMISP